MLFDLKVINSVLGQLEEERGIPREKVLEAISSALATAYNKEYGKRGRIVRATFDLNTGKTEFYQVKEVVDSTQVLMEDEEKTDDEDVRIRFNPERHMLLEDAKIIKKDAEVGSEIIFPLEHKDDFGRIASQTAKQVIMQKIREAERVSVLGEFEKREGEIVTGTVQRIERGNIFVDLGRTVGILPYEEQIPGERYRQGERVRAYLFRVDENARGVFLRLSRSHPRFIEELFKLESPEVANKTVEIKGVAREGGSRTKIAVASTDEHVDPVGAMVGQRGVRVSTVMSELGGEKIDIIEWSADPKQYIQEALSPATAVSVDINEEEHKATVTVTEDQQSLAIGKGGQNVRLAAKLTGWKIDIVSAQGEGLATAEAPEEAAAPATETPATEASVETPKE